MIRKTSFKMVKFIPEDLAGILPLSCPERSDHHRRPMLPCNLAIRGRARATLVKVHPHNQIVQDPVKTVNASQPA